MYQFKDRKEIKEFIAAEVLTSAEVIDVLDISRARLSQMIKDGKIIPIKKTKRDSLFLKVEIEEKKVEMSELRKKYRPYE
ncbi:DNA-binding protein [Chengkuizengella sp. SCS-71B]|uniref:DNA-binding protein n=1 Tax=Chengkuizengella sp. SCS-71B TaxID=3115290 RepID=UPI0032C23A74